MNLACSMLFKIVPLAALGAGPEITNNMGINGTAYFLAGVTRRSCRRQLRRRIRDQLLASSWRARCDVR